MNKNNFLLSKNQFLLLFLSFFLLICGFCLMSGGSVENPEIFDEDVFSFRRTKFASFVVVSGYILVAFLLLKPQYKK